MKAKFVSMVEFVKDCSEAAPKTFWFVSTLMLAAATIVFYSGAKNANAYLVVFGFATLASTVSVMALGFERSLYLSRKAWYASLDAKHRTQK